MTPLPTAAVPTTEDQEMDTEDFDIPDFTDRDYCARCGVLTNDDYGLVPADFAMPLLCVCCADDVRGDGK